jgi:fatty acid desaturase
MPACSPRAFGSGSSRLEVDDDCSCTTEFLRVLQAAFTTRRATPPYRDAVQKDEGFTGENEAAPRPVPGELTHLRPANAHGLVIVALAAAVTAAGIWLSLQPGVGLWLAGQFLTAAALLQWFVLLHECGHETLFRSRRWHRFVGPIAGALALIPFESWRRVHGRHHKWTGWQDLDPTATSLLPRQRSRMERIAVNVCWRLWIPLFSCVYRLHNYWNLPRLMTMFPTPQERGRLQRSLLCLAAGYGLLLAMAGPAVIVRVGALALLLSGIAEDVLLLSQHAHVPQHVSGGSPVQPYPAPDQEVFTRSLRLPAWASAWLLHFDAHELHHMYPFVPGYRLRSVAYQPAHEVGWWEWIRRAKRLPGEVLLFQNRNDSGWDL